MTPGLVYPDRTTFERLRRARSSVSFVTRGPAGDARGLFAPMARAAHRPLLLESSRIGRETGRYSFLLGDPAAVFRSRGTSWKLTPSRTGSVFAAQAGTGDPFEALRRLMSSHRPVEKGPLPFAGGAAGLFAYELKNRIERFTARVRDPWKLPDIDLGFYDRGKVIDHRTRRTYAFRWFGAREVRQKSYDECLEAACRPAAPLDAKKSFRKTPPVRVRLIGRPAQSRKRFVDAVRQIRERIRQGDVYQVNLSQRLEFEFSGHPYELYLRQARLNPTAFAAYADLDGVTLVSASPERLARVEGGRVSTRPIAGTRPRSANRRKDRALTSELLLSPKERAEHVMLVDLERNDLGRVCKPGSVQVNELMAVEAYSHVKHIVSNVVGVLDRSKDVWDVIRAVFPGGTITGAPKIRAMELIDQLERHARGPYTGSLGYVGFDGDCDLNIVIRTLWTRGSKAYLQAGAGIVADSDPRKEYEETLHKAGAFLDVLGLGRLHQKIAVG